MEPIGAYSSISLELKPKMIEYERAPRNFPSSIVPYDTQTLVKAYITFLSTPCNFLGASLFNRARDERRSILSVLG